MLRRLYRSTVPKEARASVHQARLFARDPVRSMSFLLDDSVRHMRARLEEVAVRFRGQRAFIMGNGPSLNKMDLDLFEGENVWGSNKCYLLFDRIRWRPRFYVAIDRRVTPSIAEEIDELTIDLPGTTFFFPLRFRRDYTLRSHRNVYWYTEVPGDPTSVFTRDATDHVFSSATVTLAALQLAASFGFNPIYLIGCDTSYTVPKTVKFEGGDSTKLVSTQDDDDNHFDKSYFGEGSKWHDPKPERMIEAYAQAKVVCDSMGVEIFNATVGGKLEVFPRVDYRDVVAAS